MTKEQWKQYEIHGNKTNIVEDSTAHFFSRVGDKSRFPVDLSCHPGKVQAFWAGADEQTGVLPCQDKVPSSSCLLALGRVGALPTWVGWWCTCPLASHLGWWPISALQEAQAEPQRMLWWDSQRRLYSCSSAHVFRHPATQSSTHLHAGRGGEGKKSNS